MTAPCAPSSGAGDERLTALYHTLLRQYGAQGWWPARHPFEMMVGAVLVQNTAWTNVVPAIAQLDRERLLDAVRLAGTPLDTVAALIRSAGTYRVKARRLHALAAFVTEAGGLEELDRRPTRELRGALLTVHGVGEETADAILCYAFARPCFVMDAYTRRLCTRLGVADGKTSDATLRRMFCRALPRDAAVLGECHALIVAHGKASCRTRPRCSDCALAPGCAHAQVATG